MWTCSAQRKRSQAGEKTQDAPHFQLFFAYLLTPGYDDTVRTAREAEKTATASTAGRAYLQARCVS
jgi:hypothetical protein